MKTPESQERAGIGGNKPHEQRTRSWDDIGWKEEAPSYVATRDEVFQLVKCWYKRILDGELCFFFCGVPDPDAKRYCWRRIDRADAAIGKEAVDAAIGEGREECKREFNNDRVWEILWHGTKEEKAALEGCSSCYCLDPGIPASEEAASAAGNGSTPSDSK
jgi:hypothetical protein